MVEATSVSASSYAARGAAGFDTEVPEPTSGAPSYKPDTSSPARECAVRIVRVALLVLSEPSIRCHVLRLRGPCRTRNRATTCRIAWPPWRTRRVTCQYEVIIVDNGSTDDTAAVVKAWSQADPRFRVAHEPRLGLSFGRTPACISRAHRCSCSRMMARSPMRARTKRCLEGDHSGWGEVSHACPNRMPRRVCRLTGGLWRWPRGASPFACLRRCLRACASVCILAPGVPWPSARRPPVAGSLPVGRSPHVPGAICDPSTEFRHG
jgi:hypothetical protein